MWAKPELEQTIISCYRFTVRRMSFTTGHYTVKVFARLVGERSPLRLSQIQITVTDEHASALSRQNGVFFELGPDNQGYIGHLSERPRGIADVND
jgi:hypothetical protein